MSQPQTVVPAPSRHGFLRRAWQLARPFWFSEERWQARTMLVTIIALALTNVFLSVLFNHWYNGFYNSLQNRDAAAFWQLIGQFALIVTASIVLAILQFYLTSLLQLRWRRWLTHRFVDRWVSDARYYQLELDRHYTDNPDQRISEDVERFASVTLQLFIGLLTAVVTLMSFVTILWQLSGSLGFQLFGHAIVIPGYMVWVALLYCGLGSWLAHLVGRRLVSLNFTQQRVEANMRYDMARLREHSRGIALMHGEAVERRSLAARFAAIWHNARAIITTQKRLIGFNAGFNQIAMIFPLVATSPRYFSGAISFGTLMQIGPAFGQVQDGLSWFVNNYAELAAWRSVVERLSGFSAALERLPAAAPRADQDLERGADIEPELCGFELSLPDAGALLKIDHLRLHRGDNVLIEAPSGSGKSLLFGALSGAWPWWQGRLRMPASVLFLPQTPYLPIGTLTEVLAYPSPPDSYPTEVLVDALRAVGLDALNGHLETHDHWAQHLSPGEQQRLSFARALLRAPRWLFLDEATAALDLDAEQALYRLLGERLPDTTLVSIAHKDTVSAFHTRQVRLNAELKVSAERAAEPRQVAALPPRDRPDGAGKPVPY